MKKFINIPYTGNEYPYKDYVKLDNLNNLEDINYFKSCTDANDNVLNINEIKQYDEAEKNMIKTEDKHTKEN